MASLRCSRCTPYSGQTAAMDVLMIRSSLRALGARTATCGLVALLAIGVGCARTPGASSAGERSSGPEAQPSSIPMAELQARILTYADSLRSRADISPEKFGEAIGFTLLPVQGNSIKTQARNLGVAEGYNYSASYFSVEAPDDYPMHSIIFYQAGKPSVTESPDGVCYWDADKAGRELERLGYSGGEESPFQRGGIRNFWRAGGEGRQTLSTTLLTYASGTNPGATKCVYEVRFGGADQ